MVQVRNVVSNLLVSIFKKSPLFSFLTTKNLPGTDIQVPPPTLSVSNANSIPLGPDEEDDGQYREDPSIYWKDPKYNNGVKHNSNKAAAPAYRPPTNYNSAPNQYYQNNVQSAPHQQQAYRQPEPEYRQPQQEYRQPEQEYRQPAYRQPAVYQPEPYQPRFQSFQAPQQRYYNPNQRSDFQQNSAIQNFDINSGSYTINYRR